MLVRQISICEQANKIKKVKTETRKNLDQSLDPRNFWMKTWPSVWGVI